MASIKLNGSQTAPHTLWFPLVTHNYTFTEWTQEGHDPQRTGYTPEKPFLPWYLIWTWNGPDSIGGTGAHFYNAPRRAHTVTGGNSVYVPAGQEGLFALNKEDGKINWHINTPGFNATPAYNKSTGYLFAGGDNGYLYKIDKNSGAIVGSYYAGNPLNKSILLVGAFALVVTDSGELHKVNTYNMSRDWVYDAHSESSTPATYSQSKNLIIFCTEDLYVHAIHFNDGTSNWRVKPSPHPATSPYTFDGYWPVVADYHGIVFVRLNLGAEGLWSGPGPNQVYPNTNNETRNYLNTNKRLKNLFALDLENGAEKFTPAVGYGGVERNINHVLSPESGPVPVVKTLQDNKEIAYISFRNGQGNPPDWRWDSHMGEMVLDDHTIPNMVAGDLRFVEFDNSYIYITDEQTPLSMAGDVLFNAHWGASESIQIIDRNNNLGLNYINPITSIPYPPVVRRIQACPGFNPISHWTNCGLGLFFDTRLWAGPGWWVYWNVLDPPTPPSTSYSGGILPRYTYVSDGLIIVEGNGGELFVLKHSRNSIQ